jgi:UDP-N-acetylglucosamine 2-epimerase (hydrolysing)
LTKKIVFLTGTRADFGKLKALVQKVEDSPDFECHIFVTGMHMLDKYGKTVNEIKKHNYKNVFTFNNQDEGADMDLVLSTTIKGFSKYIKALDPDLIIVHGDRVEALGGAIVGALNNTLVAHIEGGEVSGTIDELIRHAVTKMCHIHFVANKEAKKRVVQMGERKESVFVIGSPDLDIMASENLPSLYEVKSRYEIPFDNYAIFCYHPVTTEIEKLGEHIEVVTNALQMSGGNYIVIYPNNDLGSDIIINRVKSLETNPRFRVLPSMRFEHYLSLMKNSDFVIGNSSAGIREAGFYAIPSVNIGNRQINRSKHPSIINVGHEVKSILSAIEKARDLNIEPSYEFGEGNSAKKFLEIIMRGEIWETPNQKQFVDLVR